VIAEAKDTSFLALLGLRPGGAEGGECTRGTDGPAGMGGGLEGPAIVMGAEESLRAASQADCTAIAVVRTLLGGFGR